MQKGQAKGLLLAAVLLLPGVPPYAHAAISPARNPLSAAFSAKTFDDFVHAIHLHESDGRVGRIFGDGGKSYGPLQISHKAWRDATKFDRSIAGKYQDCSSLEYSRKVMLAYLRLHDRKALELGDWESCARLWNSGPNWRAKKRTTNLYWASVRGHLLRANS